MIPSWCLPSRSVVSWQMARLGEPFVAVEVPCTVASALRARGAWQLGEPAYFDRETWIFRTAVDAAPGEALFFEGLTPACEVHVDGTSFALADNMFVPLTVPLAAEGGRHSIEIHCRPVDLTKKKPRARWRSRIFDDPQRRWIRATAIGHTPTFGPSFATVGPWRPVRLGRRVFDSLDVRVSLDGKRGVVRLRGTLTASTQLRVSLARAGSTAILAAATSVGPAFDLELTVDDAQLWWPHTHGPQPLYTLSLELDLGGPARFTTDVGFRRVELDADMTLRVNGQAVFCRGVNWTPVDTIAMGGDPSPEIARLRDAGCNMLRVPANTLYESDAFYRGCAAAGILVWHDFMFASLDFPFADTPFADSARAEASAFLGRVQSAPCIAVLSANSEVRMQAHLMGVTPPAEPFYDTVLPQLCTEVRPDVPFVPGSPSGGVLGIEPRSGCSHYYGVGAYRRPLSDALLSGVRFAPEALAFAQRPSAESKARWHDVPWERRILRFDAGASDFADENEHYVREVFRVDPLTLRTNDRPLYDALLDIVAGVVMEETYATWRSMGNRPGACHGALVWLLRDMWRSSGLGIIDADGRPKPAFHYLRRAFAPRAVFLRDEGTNGLDVHVINERPEPHEATLVLQLYRDDRLLETFTRDVSVPAVGHVSLAGADIMGRFADLSFAFRFGPRPYDFVVARWGDGFPAFFFPGSIPVPSVRDIGLTALRRGERANISTRAYAHTVILENAPDAEDNYFHMAPGEARELRVGPGEVRISALNACDAVRI